MDIGLIGLIGSIVSPIILFILANIHVTLRRLSDRMEDIQKSFHEHAVQDMKEHRNLGERLVRVEESIKD